jgi:hypothetical protein
MQSAPEEEYQPDFMTAHVQKAQKQLSPVRIPLQGKPTAIGADSYTVVRGKEIQAYTRAVSAVTGGISAMGMEQGKSSINADSFLMAKMKAIKTELPKQRPHENIAQQDLPQPHMPADSMELVRAKNSPFKAQKPRNRFNLMSAPDSKVSAKLDNVGHFDLNALETQTNMQSKKHTLGAYNKPYQGVKGTSAATDLYIAEPLKYQKNMSAVAVKNTKDYQGIKATIPVNDRLLTEYKTQQTAIAESNMPPVLPFPTLDEEDFFAQHLKSSQALANDAHRVHPHLGDVAVPGQGIDVRNEAILHAEEEAAAEAAAQTPVTPAAAAAADSAALDNPMAA